MGCYVWQASRYQQGQSWGHIARMFPKFSSKFSKLVLDFIKVELQLAIHMVLQRKLTSLQSKLQVLKGEIFIAATAIYLVLMSTMSHVIDVPLFPTRKVYMFEGFQVLINAHAVELLDWIMFPQLPGPWAGAPLHLYPLLHHTFHHLIMLLEM